MDYGILPPEINSSRIYAGPGSGPMLAAASAWDGLAAELGSAASGHTAVISELTEGPWQGPASASMAAAATQYASWMSSAAAQAEQTASQAQAAAAAFEAAFAMTVPPAVVAANRAQLAALVATNVLGQNTPAIAVTEALYGEMWAQDAAAMYGYAGSSAAAATVTPFSSPPQTTSPAAAASQGGAVAQATASSAGTGAQSTLTQVVSTLPNTLNQLASPLSAASVNPFAPGSNTATTGIARSVQSAGRPNRIGRGNLLDLWSFERDSLGQLAQSGQHQPGRDDRVRGYRVLGSGWSGCFRFQPGVILGVHRARGDEHRGSRCASDQFTGLTRTGLGRDGSRHAGREGVGAAKLGHLRARGRPTCWHAAGCSGRLGDPPGCGDGGDGRNTGDARHARYTAGQPWHSRLRLCRPPLRVPPHRRRPSTGRRIADRSWTVTFTPDTVYVRRRCWRRRRRGRPGALHHDS